LTEKLIFFSNVLKLFLQAQPQRCLFWSAYQCRFNRSTKRLAAF